MRSLLVLSSMLLAPLRADSFDARPIDAAIRDGMKVWNVPGVAVVIVVDDRVVYLGGHGVHEAGKKSPVTPDTLFAISSCSKAFTTALVSLLADEGKIDWDDRVR